jgi:ferric-dicitrate binding protein FerR (iron transport regulator)
MNIKVVGTVFGVKEYDDDLSSSVSVASGKVEVGLADEKVLLERDQKVTFNKNTGNFEKKTIDAGDDLSWTDGSLYFHRTPVREVINTLNRHFPQVDIVLAEGDYSTIVLTGKHENFTPEGIIKGIAFTAGLKWTKTEKNKYILYK